MKTVVILILSALCFQNKFEVISIENICDSYSRNDTCKIIVVNNTEESFYYCFAVELYDSVLFWREVSGNIDGSTSKLSLMNQLKGSEKNVELFIINNVVDNYYLYPGVYRLRLDYIKNLNEVGKSIYSIPFKIY